MNRRSLFRTFFLLFAVVMLYFFFSRFLPKPLYTKTEVMRVDIEHDRGMLQLVGKDDRIDVMDPGWIRDIIEDAKRNPRHEILATYTNYLFVLNKEERRYNKLESWSPIDH